MLENLEPVVEDKPVLTQPKSVKKRVEASFAEVGPDTGPHDTTTVPVYRSSHGIPFSVPVDPEHESIRFGASFEARS